MGRNRIFLVVGVLVVAMVLTYILTRGEKGIDSKPAPESSATSAIPEAAVPIADASAGAADRAADADVAVDASDARAAAPPSETAARAPRTTTLIDKQDGMTVELAPGDKIVLMLRANPTSGYDWALLKGPSALGQPDTSYRPSGEEIGGFGVRRIVFTLKDPLPAGDHPVELGYQRSFEQGKPPTRSFHFIVRAPR